MISREFVYEFSNFDDISARENDKKSGAHDISQREMGVRYGIEGGMAWKGRGKGRERGSMAWKGGGTERKREGVVWKEGSTVWKGGVLFL